MRFLVLFCLVAGAAADGVDLYVLAGQNRAGDSANIADVRKVDDAYFHFGADWLALDLEQVRTSHRKGQYGLELGFALGAERPVYIAKYAAGAGLHHGWHVSRWDGGEPTPRRRNFYPGESPTDPHRGTVYAGLLRKVESAMSGLQKQGHRPILRGLVWMQGEQDGKHAESAKSYGENLARLHRRLMEDLGQEFPMISCKPGETELVAQGKALAAALKPEPEPVQAAIHSIPEFFEAYCSKCHNPDKKKGGINFAELADFTLENSQHWQDVLDNLQRGDMPPEDETQPIDENRQRFVGLVRAELDRLYAESDSRDLRFTRLTNSQIAWSLQDLLQIDRDIRGDLIQDPVDKHGESLQSSLEFTAGHMELYLAALQTAVDLAVPDLANPPTPYQIHGNDWEQQHYLNRNDLAHGNRRKHKRYRGPKWLGDDFQIPLPPNHFFRIYIDDNRAEGAFRVRLRVRNQPPQNGGERVAHECSLFFDKGFKSPMHTIGSFTVAPSEGSQTFELFGNVFEFPGVDPAPLGEDEDPYGIMAHFKYRFLTFKNCSPLHSPADKPVTNKDWIVHGDGHFVRADDRWIDAWGDDFGKKAWLKRSHGGSNHDSRGRPSVYKKVMKDTGYVVIERIEFDLPWQWPPASVQPYMADGTLSAAAIERGILDLARRAWRRPLTHDEDRELRSLIGDTLKNAESKADALRDLMMAVLSDARFLFLQAVDNSGHELAARQAAFLWRSVPDAESASVSEMLADPRAERFLADFAESWLALDKLDQIAINPNYYAWWNPKFKDYIRQEPAAFLSTLLREDLSCLNLLNSDFVVINDMMAQYYGLPKPNSGHRFGPSPAPPDRGGVLTQAAFLLAHGDGEDAHAVNRGVWLRGRLLGDPPRDPPPEVPALEDQDEAGELSTRRRLEIHRKGICMDCHRDIDPWGIAMEGFDATGKPRTRVLRIGAKRHFFPVDSAVTVRGEPVSGMDDLRRTLREKHAADFAHGFSASLFSFALGRPLDYRDDAAVTALAAEFANSDYRLHALSEAIVKRPEFQAPHKRP